MTENDKQTEEKIFEAATDVFVEKGMDGARMQDIANHAGINKALLHYYFRTKDRLFNAVFEKIAGKIFRKFAPVFDEKLSLEEKIRFFFKEHITFLQENPRLPAFILNEINRNPARLRKILNNIDINSMRIMLYEQHREELKKYNVTEAALPQIMVSMAAMSVFPFAARGVLEGIFEKTGIDFDQYIEQRKEFAAEFVIKAIKK
ncbi:MAG TPA: TetR/AcrR family transcriptional regulator [Bacteroidales bacterium]|nr:TetR/AcrR family transcriptional regulator [Bacteroidales bacterium]